MFTIGKLAALTSVSNNTRTPIPRNADHRAACFLKRVDLGIKPCKIDVMLCEETWAPHRDRRCVRYRCTEMPQRIRHREKLRGAQRPPQPRPAPGGAPMTLRQRRR
ncbi:MAG: hypothetical protein J0H17_20050, partial [Rhizobiales bacterium]|nr:hypothetical protein [Hyphomicrobiales bacterium]